MLNFAASCEGWVMFLWLVLERQQFSQSNVQKLAALVGIDVSRNPKGHVQG